MSLVSELAALEVARQKSERDNMEAARFRWQQLAVRAKQAFDDIAAEAKRAVEEYNTLPGKSVASLHCESCAFEIVKHGRTDKVFRVHLSSTVPPEIECAGFERSGPVKSAQQQASAYVLDPDSSLCAWIRKLGTTTARISSKEVLSDILKWALG